MIGPRLRLPVEKGLKGVVGVLVHIGIHPHIITMGTLAAAAGAAAALVCGHYITAFVLVALAGILDVVDGPVARASGKDSRFGNYLDAVTDKYVEVVILTGFAFSGRALPAFLALSGNFLVSYVKPRLALVIPCDNHDWPAFGERAERILLILIGLAVFIYTPVLWGCDTLSVTLYCLAILSHFGALQRVVYASRLIKNYRDKEENK